MKIACIVLRYEEPGWTDETLKCIPSSHRKNVFFADRHGVGNMSKAFNEACVQAFRDSIYSMPEAIFWSTNVTFDPGVIDRMYELLFSDSRIAAVHAMHDSDHAHLHPGNTPGEIPFIELTCAMFKVDALGEIGGMDELMPYWGMDLDWSHRAKQAGWKLFRGPDAVSHTYLRNIKNKHPISKIREELRAYHHNLTIQRLTEIYGANWKQILWP